MISSLRVHPDFDAIVAQLLKADPRGELAIVNGDDELQQQDISLAKLQRRKSHSHLIRNAIMNTCCSNRISTRCRLIQNYRREVEALFYETCILVENFIT